VSFSVVILSKKAENFVPCAEAIRRCGETCQIILIDDGIDLSFLPREDLMPCLGFNMRHDQPFIFSRNANKGIQLAGADDVILLNDDALLETPGGFSALATVAAEHPEFGVISAVTNNVGNPAQRPQGGTALRGEARTVAFVCVYIPRTTIERVGFLDERYCLDYGVEDNDYCEATRQAGLKLGIFDGCYVDHSKLKSTYRGDPSRPARSVRNLELFEKKWGHPA
jgi:GT2 family glycosyltransferase